ncbi:5-(carboxyamino)imidazole ribonucleotide synthase [Murinocardiopsis flavida]|uniref:N5-carboxyaminoimidazole ribonucleotide synthase n=1 Tax=Murinocardiopsis flavida TaxID=645275 RepID=A0A2P8DII9_9ACTN|nr:5-(carboxyamino)imidazole ribonucleotide synthase [Murinocardiopsis flavida]PSK97040.1 5-(carboxyamino)imidazole ribonucleotide synthase [Murinocardiopsis flavida]
MSERNQPAPSVGIIGGGQLARMAQQAAIPLGVDLRVFAKSGTESAALVSAGVRLGDERSVGDLTDFAKTCDVLTFDHEHVPQPVLRALVDSGAAVRPGPDALRYAQDKLLMRRRAEELGAPCPRWRELPAGPDAAAELAAFAAETGWPVVLKAARGGYDGKGVWVADGPDSAAEVIRGAAAADVPLLVEERVGFTRELAVQVARSPYGQVAAYPVVETVQRDGICHEVLAPAPGLDDDTAVAAQRLAIDIAHELDVVGMLAVELFETPGGVLVNELAMRPHNSGHWSMDGAVTGQFEQHLRAVLDLPLGSPRTTAPATVMANVLGGTDPDVFSRYIHVMAKDPELKVHFYGKEVRPGRKIGHVTVSGDDHRDLLARARDAAAYLKGDL